MVGAIDMFFKKLSKVNKSKLTDNISNEKKELLLEKPSLETINKILKDTDDLEQLYYKKNSAVVLYFPSLVDMNRLEEQYLNPISMLEKANLMKWIEEKDLTEVNEIKQLSIEIMSGSVALFIDDKVYTANVYGPETRGIEKSETETAIVGSHDAFVEDIGTNLSLIRRRIKSPKLKVLKFKVGEVAKQTLYVVYIEDIVAPEIVQELKKRIENIEIDVVNDITMLAQLIDEYPDSLFPQYFTSEIPDVIRSKLISGKAAVLMEGSPVVLTAPASFFEFIQSSDDYNQRWAIGTSLRLIRIISIIITLTFTAMYVSVVTFHYEMLPEDILITIAESRARVPFPPILEAILMELTIELLREAGARLPTKIGQTIGIVGGIVIGQAAVDAGLTSNVLIIAVASSAIASFTLPSYTMANSIRIVRFGLIIMAGFFGIFGMMIAFALLMIHVTSLTSLKTPYFIPVSPLYFKDWIDIFIRGPYKAMKTRPVQSDTNNKQRHKMRQ